jgi:diguanylate cyclase (GGDEF)-like protein/PAS domain S-box-containing protein
MLSSERPWPPAAGITMTEPGDAAHELDFRSLFEALPTAYLVLGRDWHIVEINEAYSRLTGRSRAELLGRAVFEAFPPPAHDGGGPDVERSFLRARDEGLVDVMPLHKYDVLDVATGAVQERYWSTITAPVPDRSGTTRFILQRVEDVTEFVTARQRLAGTATEPDEELTARVRAAEAELYLRLQELAASRAAESETAAALSQSEARAQAVLDTAVDAILTFRAGVVESFNRAAEVMFGCAADQAVGAAVSVFVPWLGIPAQAEPDASVETAGRAEGLAGSGREALGRRHDGSTFPIELAVSEVGAGSGLFTVIARDISERKRLEEQLAHQSVHDPLTGLANRTLLRDRLEHAVTRLVRHPGTLAVLFVDLDHFKDVNDRWGHAAGDELLTEVAHRLSAVARREDLVARFGGDEFVVLCEELSDATDDGEVIAARFAAVVAAPVQLSNGCTVTPAASVGAIVDTGRRTAEQLLRAADAAMYAIKRRRQAGAVASGVNPVIGQETRRADEA